LTRDMGVNLAGVEIVLNMREKMEQMQKQMREFVELVQRELANHPASQEEIQHALVRVIPRSVTPVLAKRR
ncbi:MAG: transcriptional regulator, MerR family, partial [Acidobacteria bacterium]|nr:transcriptional regulator, MerR family [Acidobacteriota bacterium]